MGDVGTVSSARFTHAAIARVGQLIRKEKIKSDPDSQTLEDVIALVFLENYFEEFSRGHDAAKLVDRRETAVALVVPEGPAVAGVETLDHCTDAVDRAGRVADRQGPVGPSVALLDEGAQHVHGQRAGVDQAVGHLPQRGQLLAFLQQPGPDVGGPHPALSPGWHWPPFHRPPSANRR